MRTHSIYWPGLEPLPLDCYCIGSAVLTVYRQGSPRELAGVYPMLGESEAWRAAELLGPGYDVSIATRSAISCRDTPLTAAGLEYFRNEFGKNTRTAASERARPVPKNTHSLAVLCS